MRDSQKSKLYAAERTIRAYTEPALGSLVEAWTFFDRVRFDSWFKRHYGRWTFRIEDGRGTRIARGGYSGRNGLGEHVGFINLPRWSRTRLVMLHEIAHALSWQQHGRDNVAVHGREYAAIYLKLVRHFLGAEAADQLKAAFKTKRVKFRPKRQLSVEARARLRERGRQLAARKREAA